MFFNIGSSRISNFLIILSAYIDVYNYFFRDILQKKLPVVCLPVIVGHGKGYVFSSFVLLRMKYDLECLK